MGINLLFVLIFIMLLIGIIVISIKLYKKSKKENNIKKKILFSLPTILYFLIIAFLFLSNINKLNYVEEQVYDRFISMINENDFFNPKEARLLDVTVKYEYSDIDREYTDSIDNYYLKVVGTNKVGGTINKCYNIYYSDYKNEWYNSVESCDDIYKSGMGFEQLESKSIKNINKAIKKYWEDLGL